MMEISGKLIQGLVVDDNEFNRMVAADMLESHGIDAQEATDGQSGWALLREKKYDVVLLDLNMPGIDGRTVCRNVRQHALNGATYIIAYTAEAQPHQRDSLRAIGFDDLLTKPISFDGLAAAIWPVLNYDGDSAEPVDLDFVPTN